MEVDASPTMPKFKQRPASRVRRSAEVAQVDAPQLSGAARDRRRGRPRGSTKSKPIEVAGAFEEHDEGGFSVNGRLNQANPYYGDGCRR